MLYVDLCILCSVNFCAKVWVELGQAKQLIQVTRELKWSLLKAEMDEQENAKQNTFRSYFAK